MLREALGADALPQVIPALEAALRLRPRRALSSAQVSSDYLRYDSYTIRAFRSIRQIAPRPLNAAESRVP